MGLYAPQPLGTIRIAKSFKRCVTVYIMKGTLVDSRRDESRRYAVGLLGHQLETCSKGDSDLSKLYVCAKISTKKHCKHCSGGDEEGE